MKEYHFTGDPWRKVSKGLEKSQLIQTHPQEENVGVAFDITFDRLLHHLNTALGQVCDRISPRLLYLSIRSFMCTLYTKRLFCCSASCIHGVSIGPPCSNEAISLGEGVSGSCFGGLNCRLSLPRIELTAGKTKTTKSLSAEAAAKTLEPLVCQIKSIALRTARHISSGFSGPLTGFDGSNPSTCAHVLNAPDTEIDFSRQGSTEALIGVMSFL